MVWFALWLAMTVVVCVLAALPAAGRPLHTRLGDAISRRWRRIRPPKPQPIGRPIEDIAASLRRIQYWLDTYADPRPIPGKATKLTAADTAYDRVLVDACHALEVPEALDGTEGLDREAERLRMQAALEDAGLVLRGRRREADR
ncbi:MAG TPA: hypothetical protein VIL94_09470 [Acidothermaceae bacterium]